MINQKKKKKNLRIDLLIPLGAFSILNVFDENLGHISHTHTHTKCKVTKFNVLISKYKKNKQFTWFEQTTTIIIIKWKTQSLRILEIENIFGFFLDFPENFFFRFVSFTFRHVVVDNFQNYVMLNAMMITGFLFIKNIFHIWRVQFFYDKY